MPNFDTIAHFRELGGLKTKDNKKIKNGYFYRCGELSHVSNPEKEILDSLKINKVFDLRKPSEAAKHPDYQGNFTYVLNSTSNDGSKFDRLFMNKGDFIYRFIKMDEAQYNYLIYSFSRGYIDIPYNKNCVKPILESLDEHKPILYHCFAGKDRTGVISLIISAALGCDYQTCLDNYLFHNSLMEKELLVYNRELDELKVSSWGRKGYLDANSARKEWFDCAWCAIFNSYLTIEDYLIQEIGISESQIADWRNFYLED